MSGIQGQINQSIQPAINTLKAGTSAAVGQANQGFANAQNAATNATGQVTQALSPYSSLGTDAYSAYLNALGIGTTSNVGGSAATAPGYLAQNAQYGTGAGFLNQNDASIAAAIQNNPNNVLIGGTAYSQLSPQAQQQAQQFYLGTPANPGTSTTTPGSSTYQDMVSQYETAAQQANNGLGSYLNNYTNAENQYNNAVNTYSNAVNGQPSGNNASLLAQLQATPGYQFALQQGLGSTNSAASAMGLAGSGAQLMALDQYGSGLATQTYQNYLGNLNTNIGQLNTGVGQASTGLNNYLSGQNQYLNSLNTGIGQYNTYTGQLANAAGVGATAAGQQASSATALGQGLQSAATTAGGQAANAQLNGSTEQAAVQAGNRYIPGLNTALLGLGSTSL